MSKSKAVMALEARLVIATEVYRNQKARIAELEALLATRGHIATPAIKSVAPIVTTFTKRDGSVWESTRTGNRTVTREVTPC